MNKLRLYVSIGIMLLALHPVVQADDRVFAEQQELTASDGAEGDLFGRAVAVDGDVAVVGALSNNDAQGAAYVFNRSGSTWTETQKLTAPDGTNGDEFGASAALDGDTLFIGASRENDINPSQGAVYVFVRQGNTWVFDQKLIAADGEQGDMFGSVVALSGDTALVGTFIHNDFQGAAYVFVRSGDNWVQQSKLTADDGEGGDRFAGSIALDANTAVVGALADPVNGIVNQGSAYVFVRNGTAWTQQAHLTASDGLTGDVFGAAVAVQGDTAFISARGDDVGADSNMGSVYVFGRTGTVWTELQKLTPAEGISGDQFGQSVALDGNKALIGASGTTVNGNDIQGAAYIFVRSGVNWLQQTQLVGSDGGSVDQFGVEVALDAETALIGAFRHTVNGTFDQGAAYVFFDPDPVATETPAVPTATPTSTPDVPTSTPEPDPDQLIQNGGFEDAASWTVKNASGDKVKCNKDKDGDGIADKIVAFTGNCAFQFKNVVGEAGKLEQNIDLSTIVPIIGDSLNLNFFAQSKGGATVKAKAVIKYADDTKTKISVESSGADVYTEFAGSGILTNTAIVKAKIGFKSAQTSGKVYVDEVSLRHLSSEVIIVPEARLGSSSR